MGRDVETPESQLGWVPLGLQRHQIPPSGDAGTPRTATLAPCTHTLICALSAPLQLHPEGVRACGGGRQHGRVRHVRAGAGGR